MRYLQKRMDIESLKEKMHPQTYSVISKHYKSLRAAQAKAVSSGLLEGKNLIVCTPTASGKTLIAEIAMSQCIHNKRGKAVYIAPLKALASEKYEYFKERYKNVALSIGDTDSSEPKLERFDIIITVSEKMDSLLRHNSPFIKHISCVVVDEIHLLNELSRGPTLEFVITMLRILLKKAQFICLSATIGNPKELAEWMDAELVLDDWRPIELKKGIYFDGEITYY